MLDAEIIKSILGSSACTYSVAALLSLFAPSAGSSFVSNRPKEVSNNIYQSFFRQSPNTYDIDNTIFSHTARKVLSKEIAVANIDSELINKMKHHLTSSDAKDKNAAMLLLSAISTIDPSFRIDLDLSMSPIQARRNDLIHLTRFNLKNKKDVAHELVEAIKTIKADTDFRLKNDPVFEEIFLESYDIPEIKPLLKIATLAIHGLHGLAKIDERKVPKKLQIIIDPDRDDTYAISFGADKDANGSYKRNLIYLGGERPDNKLLAGTLFHELAHFIADEVFKNGCNPYGSEDTKSQQEFERICHLLRQKKNDVHPVISAVFSQRYRITLASVFGQSHIKRMFNDDNEIIITNTNNAYMLYYRADQDGAKKIFKYSIKHHKLIALLNNKEFDDSACDDNDIEDEVDTLFARLTKKTIFTYLKSDWHCELIVRVPHLIAMTDHDDPYEDIEPDCSALLTFYRDNFLPACKSHIKTIIEREAESDLETANVCIINKKIF